MAVKYRTQAQIDADIARENQARRARRMDYDAMRTLANPGSHSAAERQFAGQWMQGRDLTGQEDALRQHEVNMVEKRGAIEKDVAKINADKDVAIGKLRFGHEDENGVRHEGSDQLVERERRMAEEAKSKSLLEGDKYRADKDLEGKKYGVNAQVDAITEKGKADLAIEQQRGKTAKEVARISGDAQVDAAETTAMATATEKERARQLRYAAREQRDYERWLRSNKKGLTNAEQAEFNQMSPDEQREFWQKKTGRAAAGNGSQGGGSNWKKLGW